MRVLFTLQIILITMKFYYTFIALIFSLFVGLAQEQKAIWNSYIAKHVEGIGSTNVRMDLIEKAPVNAFNYIGSVQVSYTKTTEDGLPDVAQLELLYQIKDSISAVMNRSMENYHVGSFTYKNFRREFFYLKDTTNFRKKIDQLFKKDFNTAKYVVKIQEDQLWSIYTDFLYPDAYIKNFMFDRDAILQLRRLGDDSKKPRKIEFYLKCTDEKLRDLFITYLKENLFTISENSKTDDTQYPHQLVFWKNLPATLDAINDITSELTTKAVHTSCMYEGWETIVVKKLKD